MNAGTIVASFANLPGIGSYAGGSVTNLSAGTISGGLGISGADTVLNGGIIRGKTTGTNPNDVGISLPSGRSFFMRSGGANVTNQSGGTISGYAGISGGLYSASSTVVNAGVITGKGTHSYGFGIYLSSGGVVTNAASGSITGATGVKLREGASTVVNSGYIGGASGTAVYLSPRYTDRLVVLPGATFIGTVNGGNSVYGFAVSTLELASAATTGTVTGLGNQFINFAQITIDAGGSWTLTGANTIGTGVTLTELTGATVTDAGTLVNKGSIVIDPSTLDAGGLIGTGSATIAAGSTLDVQGTIASGETIRFAGPGAYLYLGDPDAVAGRVTNFDVAETILLHGVAAPSVTYSSGVLSFAGGGFALSLASAVTVTASMSGDGAAVTVLCFCANTQILTPSGERPVQALAVGDQVTTWRGAARHIVWIGVGKVLATRGRRNAATPVIVRKGALADNVPCHDLHVTKGHALWLDGVLIPVEYLVNHRSIEWDDRAQEVEVYHIELDAHDVLVANGAPAESYRDDGNRWLFRNANTGWDLPPQEPCAPVLTGGPIVDAVWRRLLDRAGKRPELPLTNEPDLRLLADGQRVNGSLRPNGYRVFDLPRRPRDLRVVSRAGSPAELGLARDPRVLGVAVRQVRLWQGRRLRVLDAADESMAEGFHAFEPDNGYRWTDGDAALPATLFADIEGACQLELLVGGAMRYPLFTEAVRRAAA